MSATLSLTPGHVDRLARWRQDPVAFGLEVLRRKAYTPDQVRILRAIARHDNVAVHSGHNCGKTACTADVFLWWLITRRPSIVITTAPTARQVNRQVWNEVRMTFKRANLGAFGLPPPQKEAMLEIAPDHYAIGISTDEPASFQGFHNPSVLAVIDEAAGVEPMIWEQVEGVTSSAGAKKLVTGNPTSPSGRFFDVCRSPVWHTIQMSCLNHPNVLEGREVFPGMVGRKWVENMREEYGEKSPVYIARVLGLFPEEGPDTLISLAWVEEAMRRTPAEPREHPAVVIGCDVARYGDNETAIVAMRDRKVAKVLHYRGKDLMGTTGRLMELKRELGNDPNTLFVVDDDGLGGGVVDRLAEMGEDVQPFRGGTEPNEKERFWNLRAEAWWTFREALREQALALPEDDRLKSQLSAVKYTVSSDGRVKLETKEEMVKRGVQSPDRADAFVMSWWGIAPLLFDPDPPRRKRPSQQRDWRSDFGDISGMPRSNI